jgi:hypothetical protein
MTFLRGGHRAPTNGRRYRGTTSVGVCVAAATRRGTRSEMVGATTVNVMRCEKGERAA